MAACGGADQAYRLLMLEHIDTLAETSAMAISNIEFDKVVVWDTGEQGGGTAGFPQSMARMLPPMMQVMNDVGGVELPGYVGRLKPELTASVSTTMVTPRATRARK